ncbi:SIMPL domain-containing protein [Flavicella sp.]|uniref:SIMPL domain-containing protein n=1 Tax=Flavicella sp. TaxID=2957742 RepID=UPI003017F5E0
MRKLALLIIVGFITISTYAQTKSFIDQPYLDITVKVDSLVFPDRIYLNIILKEEDLKGKITLETLETKLKNLLKKNGVNIAKDLTVLDMRSNYKKYFLREKEILKMKMFSLLLHEASTAANIFVAMEESGISNVSLEKTEYSKKEELEINLKVKAIVKAKKHALVLANALGQKVGKAIYVLDRNQNTNIYYRNVYNEQIPIGTTNEIKDKKIEIEFQKIKFESTVSVKFKLE